MESNADNGLVDPSGCPLPPFIVMERGDSLDIWSERAKPDVWQSVSVCACLPACCPIGIEPVLSSIESRLRFCSSWSMWAQHVCV